MDYLIGVSYNLQIKNNISSDEEEQFNENENL